VIGSKRMWQVTSAIDAVLYAVWPLIEGFWVFVAMMVVLSVSEAGRRAGRGAYTLAVFPRDERVRSQAYLRAARNVGYTLGALASGVALATGSDDVIRAVPLVTAVVLAVNAVWVFRLPDVSDRPTGTARSSRPWSTPASGAARCTTAASS
jgi:predicted MFS family arabinose efflux permease